MESDGAMCERAPDVTRLVAAVCRCVPLDDPVLGEAFFPAHLPVALIDAVYAVAGGNGVEAPGAFAERYCRHVRIERTRTDRWSFPPPEEQHTLGDFARCVDTLGIEAFEAAVFRTGCRAAGATRTSARSVLSAAAALRSIGVHVLQDVAARGPGAIRSALRGLVEDDERVIRRLLMYTGDDDFVLGDRCVRGFVAFALGRRSVTGERAVELARACAHEMLLSPRYLDAQIWDEDRYRI